MSQVADEGDGESELYSISNTYHGLCSNALASDSNSVARKVRRGPARDVLFRLRKTAFEFPVPAGL